MCLEPGAVKKFPACSCSGPQASSPQGGKTLNPSFSPERGSSLNQSLWKLPLISDSIMAHLMLMRGMGPAWTPKTVLFLLPHTASSKTGNLPSMGMLGR